MSDVYDDDILLWSKHQAALLRRVAAGEPVNEALDWPNIIEEIESVGNEQRFAVESNLVQALRHMLKAEAWPSAPYVPHWQAEARLFSATAASRCTRSIRQRLDLARLYRRALAGLPATIDGQPPLPVQDICRWTLDELLQEP